MLSIYHSFRRRMTVALASHFKEVVKEHVMFSMFLLFCLWKMTNSPSDWKKFFCFPILLPVSALTTEMVTRPLQYWHISNNSIQLLSWYNFYWTFDREALWLVHFFANLNIYTPLPWENWKGEHIYSLHLSRRHLNDTVPSKTSSEHVSS